MRDCTVSACSSAGKGDDHVIGEGWPPAHDHSNVVDWFGSEADSDDVPAGGVESIFIMSTQNVTSATRYETVLASDHSHVLGLQETRLSKFSAGQWEKRMRFRNWQAVIGEPPTLAVRSNSVSEPTSSVAGGVLAMC